MIRPGTFAIVALVSLAPPACAEDVIASVSNHRVTVTPNYTGEELVLFGSIEAEAKQPLRPPYDIVVTVSGPRADTVTRRKERTLGIWINRASRQFINVPSYLGIYANRPLNQIATPELQRTQQLGLTNFPLTQRIGTDYADVVATDPFRSAFVRLRNEHGLYRESDNAVTFLTPTLFRTGISLPAEVTTGTYGVEIKLFASGKLVATTQTAFEIVKVGFEQFIATSARQHGFLYGLATALMALAIGWLGWIVFRRD